MSPVPPWPLWQAFTIADSIGYMPNSRPTKNPVIDDTGIEVILQVLTDPRQVVRNRNAVRAQQFAQQHCHTGSTTSPEGQIEGRLRPSRERICDGMKYSAP